ncbi:MAG: hypothetical protein BWY92_01626 [Firmicutes bacterium ADurb.BinA052]|nr:MAG: hypothetical protein BWY92_01626 [Firmicutes bacterium ADurb.BinA052]
MMTPTTAPITGTMMMIDVERGTSWRIAIMMPPTHMTGAEIMMLRLINTAICTCCTSLVLRVISEGVPNWSTSACEKLCTLRKTSLRRSRPKDMAVLEPQYTETMEHPASRRVTRSIKPPVLRM